MEQCAIEWLSIDTCLSQQDEFNVWVAKRFPTVSKRVPFGPAHQSNEEIVVVEWKHNEEDFRIRAKPMGKHKAAVEHLLSDLRECLLVIVEDPGTDTQKRARVIRLLSWAIPFGVPVETSVTTLLTRFSRSELGFATSRAMPAWFPGTTGIDSKVRSLAANLLKEADVELWIEEQISAVNQGFQEDAPSRDLNSLSTTIVEGILKCRSRSRVPKEVTVLLGGVPRYLIHGAHEVVVRIDEQDAKMKSTQVVFIPPPVMYGRAQVEFGLCKWQIGSVMDAGLETQPQLYNPLTVAYRLRRAATSSDQSKAEFQILVRTLVKPRDQNPPLVDMLKVVLIMPDNFVIVSSRLQISVGETSSNGSRLTWNIRPGATTPAEPMLLAGLVVCQSDKQDGSLPFMTGETSCALVEFTLLGQSMRASEVNIVGATSSDVNHPPRISLDNRKVSQGNFVVWNPFGSVLDGVPLEILLEKLRV